jgi:hypothetical protein
MTLAPVPPLELPLELPELLPELLPDELPDELPELLPDPPELLPDESLLASGPGVAGVLLLLQPAALTAAKAPPWTWVARPFLTQFLSCMVTLLAKVE